MTQEEKQLLIRDLCARESYGYVRCKWIVKSFNPDTFDEELEINEARITFIEPNTNSVHLFGKEIPVDIEEVKPYLRPMSSMTEDEWKEYNQVIGKSFSFTDEVDWLNAHHFDYRGLIEKGLALEAPEGMYKEN